MKKTVKQITLATALLLVCNSVSAQNTSKFIINGVLKNFKTMPKKLFLVYPEYENKKPDSSIVVNGTYKFTGEIENDALPLTLAFGPELDTMSPQIYDLKADLIILKGETKVVSDGILYNYIETGASENIYSQYKDIYWKYLKAITEYRNKMKNFDFITRQSVREIVYAKLNADTKDYIKDHYNFVVQNPNSALAPQIVYKIASSLKEQGQVDSLINILSAGPAKSKVRTVVLGWLQERKKVLIAEQVVSAGKMAPDFTQNDVDGNPVKLSSFRGKFVLVDFWASWCTPCRAENPNLIKAYAKYKNKNFEILGVSLDDADAKMAWVNAIKQDRLTWPQVSELKGWKAEVVKLYAITSIPQNFLIDPDGKIIATNLRGEELDKALDKFLK